MAGNFRLKFKSCLKNFLRNILPHSSLKLKYLYLTIALLFFNFFWNLQIFYQMFLLQQVKRKVIITNENGKYELNDEFPNNVRFKKILKLHGVIV